MVRKKFCCITMALALCSLVLAGCSDVKDVEQAKVSEKTTTRQTVDSIEQYGQRPLDKARAAQQMGEQRTNDIDEALKNQ